MAEIYSTISIVCFFFAGAFLIVAIVVFFTQNVLGTIKEMTGQTQASWVLTTQGKGKKTKGDKKETVTIQPKARFVGESTTEPESMEDEVPTTFDNGEVKKESLVGFYENMENNPQKAVTDPGGHAGASAPSVPPEIPTDAELTPLEGKPMLEDEEPTADEEQPTDSADVLTEKRNSSVQDNQEVEEEATQFEEEEATQVYEPATEEPLDDDIDFRILESIMYVHTDQVIWI